MKSILKGLNYIFALLLICIAIFLAYITIPAFGNKALIVRSGSMQPAIKTGDLTVVHVKEGIISPTSDQINKYKEGDIIAFKAEKDPSVLTTHRITSVQVRDGQIFYQTKGDANQIPDKQLVAQKFVIGKSTFTVPAIGKLFAFAKTKQGFALLVLIPAIFVILIEAINLTKELNKIIRARRMLRQDPESEVEKGELLGPVGLRVLMPLVVSMMFFHNSYAFFSDTATSTSNTFTAAQSFGTDHLVISEVQIDGGTGAANNNDFVELYNPTSSPFNLNGHRLVKRTAAAVPSDDQLYNWTTDTFVPAHGFYLWASSSNAAFLAIIDENVSSSETLAGNNSVAVRQGALNTGTIIDSLSWSSVSGSFTEGTRFSPDPGVNQSMERKALSTSTAITMGIGGVDESKGNGLDTNNNATDFYLRAASQPQNSSSAAETP